jgi:protein TonB
MFEHSLIDLEAKPSTRRRWLSLPIAVGLHVAGLTAFAFASYWNVGAVLDPSVNMGPVTFFELPPPPPGGGGRQPKPQTQEIKKAAAPQPPTKPIQPTADAVPDKPPAPASNDAVRDVTQGLPTGGPTTGDDIGTGNGTGGSGDGIGIGKGHGDGPTEGPGIGETAPIHLSFGMTRPEVLYQVQPRYSEQARRAGVQGMVIVEAVIDEQGQVTKVRLIRGLPMALDQAAMQAVQQWRFKPAMLNGHPVKVFYTLTVNFTIQR